MKSKIGIAVLLLAVSSLSISLLGYIGYYWWILDALNSFAPFSCAISTIGMLYALANPRSTLAHRLLLVSIAGATLSGMRVIPEYARPTTPPSHPNLPGEIKIIQLNGWSSNTRIEDTAKWIANQNADVVVVEEAEAPLRRSIVKYSGYHETIELAKVSIFSKYPAARREFEIGPPWKTMPSVARATFSSPHGEFTVVGLHYTWPTNSVQRSHPARISEVLSRYNHRNLIVLGDFNLTPWSFALARQDAIFGLERRTRGIFTWPAQPITRGNIWFPFPFLAIDHIYAGQGWRTVKVERGPRLGSDHYPVIAILAPAP